MFIYYKTKCKCIKFQSSHLVLMINISIIPRNGLRHLSPTNNIRIKVNPPLKELMTRNTMVYKSTRFVEKH